VSGAGGTSALQGESVASVFGGVDAVVGIVAVSTGDVLSSNTATPVVAKIAAAAAKRLREAEADATFEAEIELDDGGRSTFLISAAKTNDAARAALVAMDITARAKEESRLRRSEAMLVDAQGVAHLGTWDWDVSEPIAKWSPELYRIYALTPESYTPSYEAYLGMVHPADRGYVRAATERVFNEHVPYSHDERIIRPDGSMRYLHTWAFPILEGAKLVRLVGVCQDITDRKHAEIAATARAEELAASNERLRAEMEEREKIELRLREAHKLEAIGRLAGGVAHDFNNLLSVVLGRAGLLERIIAGASLSEKDKPPASNHVREIIQVARQAARLTQQLLVFSREHVISRERLDVSAIIADSGPVLERLIGEDMELRFDVEKGCLIEGDRSQIEQVVMNLVMNARDAMPAGGPVEVKLESRLREGRPPPTTADVDPSRDYVVLTVTDHGVGMSKETLGRIFDPFFTTKEQGHGLGLSTVYGIVRQLGGTVVVTSEPNLGSSFVVYIPTAPLASVPNAPRANMGDLRGSSTILVVEDQESVRNLVRIQLEDLGYRVLSAADAKQALDIAIDPATRIDLLLTDVVMPRVDGRKLAEEMRAARPRLDVLFMSGWIDRPLLAELEAQAAPILRKPFTHEELGLAVRRALRAGPTLSQPPPTSD
jgi:two-component system cell cycle sensor histidine kinase/response regulator CckA